MMFFGLFQYRVSTFIHDIKAKCPTGASCSFGRDYILLKSDRSPVPKK